MLKFKTVDLCAGIGGIRRGFELTGQFKNVLSAEIDELACQTYEHLFSDNPRNDLTSKEFKDKMLVTKYDALLAGFPCQAFSKVGRKLGFKDKTKGTIFFDIAEVIQQTHPKIVFLENVENLVRHDNGNTFKTIISVLEQELDYKVVGVNCDEGGNLAYDPRSFIRNTKDFGIPQNRPRVFIVAFSRKYFGTHLTLIPNLLPESRDADPIYQDVREVLETGSVPVKYFLSSGYLETLEKHKLRQNSKGYGFGMKVVNAPSIEHPIASTLLATGGSGRERNLVIDYDNGRLYAGQVVKEKKTPVNSKYIRTMTPTEWGKLQGFINYAFIDESGIDKFSFPDSISDVQKFKQFGNSVSIPVIESLANYICQCIELMTNDFSAIEKRLFTMFGTNFMMCYQLSQTLGNTMRESTMMKMFDAYYSMGLDTEFRTSDFAQAINSSIPRAVQLLAQLESVGFVNKISRGKYYITSSFIKHLITDETDLDYYDNLIPV